MLAFSRPRPAIVPDAAPLRPARRTPFRSRQPRHLCRARAGSRCIAGLSYCPCHEAAVDGKAEESSEVRRQAARAAEGWYDAFTHDVFG
ncbi:MAG: hypothetical protein E5X51_11950 [Mesorhizobium sp.]|nr:MAG: hypothetical protein E5X51_11950 [Mesorhizobium sp.]